MFGRVMHLATKHTLCVFYILYVCVLCVLCINGWRCVLEHVCLYVWWCLPWPICQPSWTLNESGHCVTIPICLDTLILILHCSCVCSFHQGHITSLTHHRQAATRMSHRNEPIAILRTDTRAYIRMQEPRC